MEYIRIKLVVMEAIVSCEIRNCIAEAIVYAVQEGVSVELNHNSRKYNIDGNRLVEAIYIQNG